MEGLKNIMGGGENRYDKQGSRSLLPVHILNETKGNMIDCVIQEQLIWGG